MSDIEFPDGGVRGIVAIFFGFPEGKTTDAEMEKHETEVLRPTIDFLKDGGFGVFMKRRATLKISPASSPDKPTFWTATNPLRCSGAPMGADGSLQTADGPHLAPSEVDGLRIDPRLRLVVFSSCHRCTLVGGIGHSTSAPRLSATTGSQFSAMSSSSTRTAMLARSSSSGSSGLTC